MRKIITSLAIVALLATTASSASAITYSGSKYGSRIVTSGMKLTITDNQADGKFPGVNYKCAGGTKQAGLVNKAGYRSSITKYAPSNITAIQPCISRPSPLPMDCGGWLY